MKSTIVSIAVLLIALAPPLATESQGAEPAATALSALALPSATVSAITTTANVAGDPAVLATTTFASIRYRPRRARVRDRYHDSYDTQGFAQVHGGAFDPDGDPSSAAMFGLRAGSSIDERVQLGLGIDWSHRSDRHSIRVSSADLPGGGTSERRLELSRSNSDLMPIMAFLQVSPAGNVGFTPYLGIGGGYELLFVSAEDFETGDNFDATYGGWGWQAWVGAAFPLSGNVRLNGEIFTNQSEVSRDVDDPLSGLTYREIVDVDGAGFRAGLSWGF